MTEVSSPDATDGNQTEALTKRENPPSSQQPIATTCPQNVSVEGRENVDPHKKSKWQRVSGLLRHSSSGIASRDGRFKRSEAIDDVDLNVGVAPSRSADRTTEKSSSPEEATVREEQPEVAPKSEKNAAPGDIQSKASQGESKPPKKKMVTAPTLKGEPHQLASTTKTPQAKTAAASKSTTATSIAQNKEEQKSSSTTKSRIQKDKNAKDELLKEAAPSSKRPKKVTLDPKRPDLKSSTQQLQVGPASVSVAEEQNRRDSSRPENNTMETRNKQGSAAAASVRQEAQTAQSQGDSGAIGAAPSKKSAGHTTTAGAVENSLVAQRIRNSGQPLDTSAPKREPVHAEAAGGVVPSSSGKQTATTHYIKHCDSAHGGGKYTADGQQSGHADADKFKHSDSSHSLRGKHAESGGAAATAITKHKEKEEKQKGKYKEERHKDGSGGGPLVNTDCGHSRSSRAGTSNNAASAAEGENGRVRGPGFMFEQTRSSRDETTIRSQDSGGSPDAADGDVSDNVFAALPVPNPHKHPCAYPKSHFKSLDRERQHTASRLAALNAAPPVVVPPLPPFVPRSKTKAKKKRLQRGDGVDQDGDEEETSAEEDDMRAVRPTDLAVPKMVVDHEDDTLGWRKRKLVGPLRQKEELLGHVAEELSKHPTGCAHTPHYLRSRSEELETPNRADLLSPHSGYPQGQNEAPETHPEYSAMTLPFESPQTLELIAASERLDMSIRQTQSLGHLSSLLSRPKTLDDYLREARLEAHSDVGPRSHLAHLHVRQAGDSEQQGTLARLYIHRSLVNWYRYQLPDGSFALHPCNSGPIRMEGDSVSLHPADNTQLVLFDAL